MDALDKVIGLGPASGPADGGARFIPSKTFAGPRDGYVFRTSDLGTGYHRDAPAADSSGGGVGGKKRARPDGGGGDGGAKDAGGGGGKKPSIRFGEDSVRTIPARRPRPTGDELLAAAEEAEERGGGGGRLIDPTDRGVRSACAALDRVHRRNQLLRAEHADSPERFMTSELALNDDLLALGQLATNVGLYREVVGAGAAETLLACLSHENSDVAMAVVNTLTELLDPSLLRADGGDDDDKQAAASPEEKAENMALLANSFVDGGGVELLSSNLGRFDESVDEDARGTEDALTLVENLLDLDRAGALRVPDGDATGERKSVAEVICRQSSLVPWLLRRMDEAEPDGDDERAARLARPIPPAVIRLHSSEVLSAILQHEDYAVHGPRLARLPKYASVFDEDGDGGGGGSEDPARPNNGEGGDDGKAGTVDGIEVLLLAIAAYRKSDPEVEVDCEYLENVFDALSASLLRDDNVTDFVEAEGIELMLRCLRQKVHSGGGALKVLSFCLSGSSSGGEGGGGGEAVRRRACEAFVGAGGIKTLFPLFMARRSAIPCPAACSEGGSRSKGDGKNKKDSKSAKRAAQARRRWLSTVERNSTDVMYALTRHASPDSAHDARSRILAKFVEEDCEKCDRAVELCLKNDERARLAEYQFYRGDGAEDAELLGGPDAVDLAAMGAKLRGGGDAFHRCCAILGFACVGSRRCRGHVMDQLRLQGSGITVVKDGLAEFAGLLSDGAQKAQIEGYIEEL